VLVKPNVRAQFYQTDASARAESLQELGLDANTFTVFLQGGGDGAARFDRMLESLLAQNMPLQIILATGTNKSLATRYEGVSNIKVLGFTRDIAQYMNLGDIIAGKAGPNILFESVALEKPFLATTFIPGQEEVNLKFIERYDLGCVCLNPSEEKSLAGEERPPTNPP
jgi:processive 1,2-diacylglycerol beta-glucosyltransferase